MATKKTAPKAASKSAAASTKKSSAPRSSTSGTKAAPAKKNTYKRPAKPRPEVARSWSVLLFAQGLILLALAFIPGQSVWAAVHKALFGIFGLTTYILGLFVLYWAVLVALEQPVRRKIIRDLVLLAFVCGTLLVFSRTDLTGMHAAQIIALLYAEGQKSFFSGGVLGAVFGGTMLALCGRPAANIILLVLVGAGLMLAADVSPADLWQMISAWRTDRQLKRRGRARPHSRQEEQHEEEFPIPEEELPPQQAPARRALPQLIRKEKVPVVDVDLGPEPVTETDVQMEPMPQEPLVGPGGTFGMFPPMRRDVQPETQEQPPEPQLEPQQPATGAEPAFDTPISLDQPVQQVEVATEPELESLILKAIQPDQEPIQPSALIQTETAREEAQNAGRPQEVQPPIYQFPPLELFEAHDTGDDPGAQEELKHNADLLVKTLDSFGVRTRVLDICRGPTVTRYELQPQAGVKISRITSLSDDIALNLATAGVRIEAPIPGKPAVGIEVPNRIKSPVGIRGILESPAYQKSTSALPLALGKDIAGAAQVGDLCKMPHLLIAGSTGSGKSVCVNSIIMGFLCNSSPEDVKLILIDPKVVELAEYNGIPHLLMPVVTEPRKAAGALGSAVAEMERRYHLFAENNVRDIKSFNKLAQQEETLEKLPYIAIIIDELADLMMVAGKEVEDYICRIAQKARAAGMHLIVATQRPSVDVITGLIKANIPSRIAFAVSSQVDSRTILDSGGAEKLLGMGDMLFLPVGAPKPVRIQGTFVKDEEITAVLDFIKQGSTAQYDEAMIAEMEKRAVPEKAAEGGSEGGDSHDPMLPHAAEVVIDAGQASTSLLQRRCKLGYARAARIMDEMEEMGIIGPYQGAKPREVLIDRQQWIEMNMNDKGPVPDEL